MNFKQFCQQITELEYRASSRCSYSFLKELSERGPKAITDPREAQDTPGLILGSIVDKTLSDGLYSPLNEYIICDDNLDVSGSTHSSKIIKYLLEKNIKLVEEDPKSIEYLNNICEVLGFSRYPKFDNALWSQINLVNLKLSDTKIISSSELAIANEMIETFRTHEFTKDIFYPSLDIEVVKQAIIFFNVGNFECRGMLDLVHVDHKRKVIKPYDIKTGSSKNFFSNFITYKYYYQGGLYSYGLKKIILDNPELEGYSVEPFRFIYISREDTKTPLIYEMPLDYCDMAMAGWTNVYGSKVKGVIDLLEEYNWYIENNQFEYTRSIAENNGVIKIDVPVKL